jgi:hypothetical protein
MGPTGIDGPVCKFIVDGRPLRPNASGGVVRTLAPEGKLTSIGVVAVRIPLMSSDGYLVRAPAERFAIALDVVQDNR